MGVRSTVEGFAVLCGLDDVTFESGVKKSRRNGRIYSVIVCNVCRLLVLLS